MEVEARLDQGVLNLVGEDLPPPKVLVLHKEIEVEVRPLSDRAFEFAAAHWKFLAGSLFFPLAVWGWKQFQGRRNKEAAAGGGTEEESTAPEPAQGGQA